MCLVNISSLGVMCFLPSLILSFLQSRQTEVGFLIHRIYILSVSFQMREICTSIVYFLLEFPGYRSYSSLEICYFYPGKLGTKFFTGRPFSHSGSEGKHTHRAAFFCTVRTLPCALLYLFSGALAIILGNDGGEPIIFSGSLRLLRCP